MTKPSAPGVEGTGAGGRERTDLAELHERVDAHVAVDAAGHDGVELVVDQAGDGGVQGGQPGGARGIGGEVRAAEVEQVRHPAGDDVRQLAGHGVLGDVEDVVEVAASGLLHDPLAGLGREAGQGRRLLEPPEHLRQPDPHARLVVLLAAEGVAEDDGDPVAVDRPARPAGVGQRRACSRDGPPLAVVHLRGDLGRDGQPPGDRVPVELAHPPADQAVRLVGGGVVLAVVQRGVPAFGGGPGDGVLAPGHVVPEHISGGGVGHDRRHPDDGDRVGVVLLHDGVRIRVGWCGGFRLRPGCGRTARPRRGPCPRRGRPVRRGWRRPGCRRAG